MARALSSRAVAAALLVCGWSLPASAFWSVQRSPVEETAVELADVTRSVARAVAAPDGRSFELRTPPVSIPPGARVRVSVGVGATDHDPLTSAWRFELALEPEATPDAPRTLASRTLDPSERAADRGWQPLAATVDGATPIEAALVVTARPVGDGSPTGKPLLGVPQILAPSADGGASRNIVLISLDTLRADRISAYGNPRPTTPTLDALARGGVRFATALAPATSTPPSHMSMLTGTLPCRHGIFGVHVEDRLPAGVATLGQLLGAHGYTTGAITEDAYVGAPYGFARGFDSFRELKQKDQRTAVGGTANVTPTGLGPATFAAARAWLRDHRDERFFLFVHTYQMHGPREPRPPYSELFREAQPTERPQSEGYVPAFHDLVRYDQLLREADDLVRDLTDTIAEIGATDRTILVVTSDHGEAFFEHGDHGHGFSLWAEATRVPLILSAPGLARPGVVTEPVGLIDVVPTVLDLVGIPVPAGLDGVSLAGRVRGGSAPGGQPGRVFYMETAPGNAQAARDERFKVMRFEDGHELAFDLAADPEEQRPLGSATDPDAVARLDRLRAELVRRHDECQRRRERSAAERTGETELDPTRREKLRALGYAE